MNNTCKLTFNFTGEEGPELMSLFELIEHKLSNLHTIKTNKFKGYIPETFICKDIECIKMKYEMKVPVKLHERVSLLLHNGVEEFNSDLDHDKYRMCLMNALSLIIVSNNVRMW